MVKTKHFIEPETYVSPACETVAAHYEQVLCGSVFNEHGLQDLSGDDIIDSNDGWV